MNRPSLGWRLLSATLATALIGTVGVTASVVATGDAALAASSVGGPITRSETLERAQYWVDRSITYTQTGPWASDGSGKTYRRDCSGLVSMAWHLSSSPVTRDFQDTQNNPWSVVTGGIDGFQPGDAMVKDGHIELFVGWVDASDHRQGAYVYSFNSNGETVQNPYADSNYGNRGRNSWSDLQTYTPIRYDKIVDDVASDVGGPAVVRANGEYHVFGISPSGQLSQNTWRPGGWLGWESLGGTVAGTPAVTYHDGQYDVFARSPRGVVYQKTWNGTWSDWKSIGGIVEGGLGAVYANGEYHVFGISPSGQLSQNTWRPGGWLGWESLGGTVAGTPAVTYHDGQYDVFARSPRGVVYQKTWNGTWSDWKSIGGIVEGGLGAVYANGEYHVFGISPSGQLSQNTWRPGGWLGWESLGGTVAGTPAVTYHDGQYDVFARSPRGVVYQKTWNGTWSDWKSIGGILG
ncbi:PLL family lectin [Phytohabitans suffuscus]|uniref:PLL-like beta propeller domain-containing protein n=1 Tax=Phytohabitans suffuscus TaxID=624315 RepID=A0A6F8YFK7_9ACTN|nr:hypothetical protein [Phytohabitans suffuscus]BCB84857.1 hypothetical protein Psuf_021700 [Phytohabitans suffuscus]